MILKKERERMSGIIKDDIWHLIAEIAERAEKKNLNPAYNLAFEVLLCSEIEDSLKKCKATSLSSRKVSNE